MNLKKKTDINKSIRSTGSIWMKGKGLAVIQIWVIRLRKTENENLRCLQMAVIFFVKLMVGKFINTFHLHSSASSAKSIGTHSVFDDPKIIFMRD